MEEAENGRIGLEKLFAQTERYCAVLLDVVMPVMDGIEVLKILNEKGTQTEIPVFLITAEADDRILKTAYSLGVMDVIHKPVIPYVVRRRIDSVIELFRARKKLSSKVEEQQSELLKQAEQIILLNMGMVEALSTAIEFRSGESGEHVHRIHDITEYLLRNTELGEGLKEEEIRQIHEACDGKILKVIIETCLLTEEEKIKAAGGISSFDDAEKFISLGASRLGTSRLIKIMKNTDNGAGY